MNCPICNNELDAMEGISESVLGCPKCRNVATRALWEAFGIAIESLNDIADLDDGSTAYNSGKFMWAKAYAKSASEQITETMVE